MTDTNDEIFAALRHAVHNDPALQTRLFELSNRDDFIAVVRQLAQSLGYALEEVDVRQAMQAGHTAWTGRR